MSKTIQSMTDPERGPVADREKEASNATTYESEQLPQDEQVLAQSLEGKEAVQVLPSPRTVHGISVCVQPFMCSPNHASPVFV